MTQAQRIILQGPQDAPRAARDDFHVVSTVQTLPTLPAFEISVTAGQLMAVIDAVLQADHELFEREYPRQMKRWCMVHGTPTHVSAVPNLTEETNAAIREAARIVISQCEVKQNG